MLFVVSIVFWGAHDDDGGGGGHNDDVNKFMGPERTGSSVSKLHSDGKSHNWALVKCFADSFVKTSL